MEFAKDSVVIIGVGPGASDLLPLRSQQYLATAEVVCGFTTVLKPVQMWLQPAAIQLQLSYKDQTARLEEAAQLAASGKPTVFCAWGDFNFSGKELVERVRLACQPYNLKIELVPGISSLQIACAQAGLAMEESLFITLHRRGGLEMATAEVVAEAAKNTRNLLILPHTFDLMPSALAALLVAAGQLTTRPLTVFERLTHPDERRLDTTLGELANNPHEFSDLSIVVLPMLTTPDSLAETAISHG